MSYTPVWTLPDIHSLLQEVSPNPMFTESGLWILRLDRIHPTVSGNKALKLSGWLKNYYEGGFQGIVTVGGPWSNHLHATCFACAAAGIPLTMLVKAHHQMETEMLRDCRQQGASIELYHHAQQQQVLDLWQQKAKDESLLMIPMGGDGDEGREGVTDYFATMDWARFETLWIASGSGTTLAGIHPILPGHLRVRALLPGFAPTPTLVQLATTDPRIQVNRDKGRFGQISPELISLAHDWLEHTGIPMDYCYTVRLLRHFLHYHSETKGPHLFIHTGGLQGNRSFTKQAQED